MIITPRYNNNHNKTPHSSSPSLDSHVTLAELMQSISIGNVVGIGIVSKRLNGLLQRSQEPEPQNCMLNCLWKKESATPGLSFFYSCACRFTTLQSAPALPFSFLLTRGIYSNRNIKFVPLLASSWNEDELHSCFCSSSIRQAICKESLSCRLLIQG